MIITGALRRLRRALHGARVTAAVVLLSAGAAPAATEGEAPRHFRLGFSYAMFTDVNENDAKASLRALSAVISRERNIQANPEPLLFHGTDQIARAVRAGEVDSVVLPIDEYWIIAGDSLFDRGLFAVQGGDPAEEYVLLVRGAGGPTTLAGLQGKHLVIHAVPRMRLGYYWLEVTLARGQQPPIAGFFGRVVRTPKLARTVLDVFFHRADACLVTRRGFQAMVELNPQVGKQLHILAASPSLVPALFAFRAGLATPFRDRVLREFSGVHVTPSGQQALTIFQVGQVAERPLSVLDEALDWLREYGVRRPEEAMVRTAELRRSHVGPIGEPNP